MRKIYYLLLSLSMVLPGMLHAQVNPSFGDDDYKKALWMTTRFYGAQRSGDGPNWLLCYHEQKGNINPEAAYKGGKSFLKDADGSYDLTGGWYDCGDHVKFGQTEFYAAYMLILGYSEFPEGYDDHYSFDYEGYRTAKDYTWAGKKGKPNGIPDILDEVKYATDYFQKAIRDAGTFYYEVGNGDYDHKNWVTSSHMSTLAVGDGGEAGGSRPVVKATGNATSMASFCGATLAAMARLYKPFDPAYAQACLDKALVCYEFVTKTAKGNVGAASGGFYGAKPKYEPDMAVFFAELYRTTGDTKYLTAAENAATYITNDSGWNHNWSIGYNNTEDLGFYLMAITNSKLAATAKKRLEYYVNTLYKPSSGYLLNVKYDTWGLLRYPASQSFIYALYDKLNGKEKTINPYVATTIDHILGKNSRNLSFVVGFAPSGYTHARFPHHRNYYGSNANKMGECKTQTGLEFGFLCGAQSFDPAAYPDNITEYESSEGGIDYNAGLVGALGYMNSILNPVNTNKFGHPTPDLGDPQSLCGIGSVTLTATVDLSNLAAGESVTYKWYKGTSTTPFEQGDAKTSVTVTTADTYHCELVEKSGAWTTRASVEVLDVLPNVNLGEDITLCNPAVVTLDATVESSVVSYQWYKDGVEIADATDSKYTVSLPGTYNCEISAMGCASQSGEVTVSSKLPFVADATSDAYGNVTLVVSEDGDYEWYDQAEGGNLLGTGSSYSTKITQNTIFYVQDAGSASFVTGPSTTTFTGTPQNWGAIGAKFTTTKALLITGFTAKPNGIYNSEPVSITVDLMKDGNKVATYTSKTETNKGNGVITNYTFTFEPAIEVPSAGDYTLIPSGNGFTAPFYENGPAYSTYSSDVLIFTGATGGQNNPFPAMFDWQIQAGSGCARALANAIYNTDSPVSVDDLSNGICDVYPNPVGDVMYVSLKGEGWNDRISVEIISLMGSVQRSEIMNSQEISSGINVSQLEQGVYLVRLTNGNHTIVKQIIKK
jgi:hypothetical protein